MHLTRLLLAALLPLPVLARTAPTISNVTDKATLESTATTAIAFTVGDLETPPADLVVGGTASDAALVPDRNIVFAGTGTSRTLTIIPAAGLSGTTTITLTVVDGDLMTATDTFVLTVHPLYTLPAEPIPDLVISADGTLTINYQIGDGTWTPSVSRSNSSLFRTVGTSSSADLRLQGTGTNRTLRLRPAPGLYGESSVTLTIIGAPGGPTSSTFKVTVNPRAVADHLFGVAERASTFDLLRNDTSPQPGSSITLQSFTQPANGTLVAGEFPGTVRYTPASGFAGQDFFSYTTVYHSGFATTGTGHVTVGNHLPLDAVHTDLRMNYVAGVWTNEARADLPFGTPNVGGSSNPTIVDFDEALLMVNPACLITLPGSLNAAVFSFLGKAPGERLWSLPQSQQPGVLWPGVSSESIASGTFAAHTPTGDPRATATAEWLRLELVDFRIPEGAVFAMYASDATPTVFWDSIDGVNGPDETAHGNNVSDTFWITVGSHAHMNWTFTHPGHYEIDCRSKAFILESGTRVEVTSPVNTLHFMVYDTGGPISTGPLTETPPTLVDDTAACTEDAGPVTIKVLLNDHSGPDLMESLAVTAVTNGNNGVVGIAADGQSVHYTPAPGFSGTDCFSYTATDEHGGQASAAVTIIARPLPIRLLPNGQVRATTRGTPGVIYQFQRSTDLSEWEPLGAPILADAAGNVTIIDPAPLPFRAFYRARPDP
jgi:surface-anchored protein